MINSNVKPSLENISGSLLNDLLNDKEVKRQFIDVRTPGEFGSSRINGFTNIPLQVLERSIKDLKKEEPVVIICASGSRSMAAARFLAGSGFLTILNVQGGMSVFGR